MKFVTAEHNGVRFPGLQTETHVIDLNRLPLSRTFADLNDFIARHSASDLAAINAEAGPTSSDRPQRYAEPPAKPASEQLGSDAEDVVAAFAFPLEDVRVLAPITRPVHDILCVGLNYQKHIEESETMLKKQGDIPKHLSYFSKRAHIVLGHGDRLALDAGLDNALDYEVELAVVIGKEGKNIKAEDALDYVFGYTILNDFSARTIQAQHGQWFRGKSLDGYTAIGPAIVHRSSLPHPLSLSLSLSVNGEVRQSSTTDYMIKGVAELIEELSSGMTLVPGDIIATGTPEGVGMGFDPPRYLQPGDRVECRIDGIGALENYIV
ncbi:MAG TPA: fumarylacetoacetate hydrolase family protein [Clostridiales bacterium]|nr:fumarylacetoacetate hydrolase family protein [Clostridiales bacterium]